MAGGILGPKSFKFEGLGGSLNAVSSNEDQIMIGGCCWKTLDRSFREEENPVVI